MLAFRMTAAQAEIFFQVCQEIHAETEEERLKVLSAMAKVGQINGITETQMTKDEYVKHLADKFGSVVKITKGEQI